MERYSRQLLFPQVGQTGQEKLGKKHVLIIGAGALGSALSEMLVRAGIQSLTIVDRDYVEYSNLQRQQLYTEQDAEESLPKAEAARRRLERVNQSVRIESIVTDATPDVMEPLVKEADLILDATDNFETRMIINDLSQKHHTPWVYGACVGSTGMCLAILPGKTPCLNCLLKAVPVQGLTCDTGGIISPAVQMAAAHQMAEALKILVEDYGAVREGLIFFDLWKNDYRQFKTRKMKKDSCLSCGSNPEYPFLKRDNVTKTAVLCGRDTVQVRPPQRMKLNFSILARQLIQGGYQVDGNAFLLNIQGEGKRMVLFEDGRALIHETKDIQEAKSLYQRILG
ncbi:ThiF family adenylyltransferase [Gracilibacillus sp. Marseille-QA3620]